MRIKIRPVRWWRSDEDRYKSRGAYTTPEQPQADVRWAVELLAGPPDPELAAALAYLDSLPTTAEALGIPSSAWDAPEHVRPIEEIMAEMSRLRRLR